MEPVSDSRPVLPVRPGMASNALLFSVQLAHTGTALSAAPLPSTAQPAPTTTAANAPPTPPFAPWVQHGRGLPVKAQAPARTAPTTTTDNACPFGRSAQLP